jgi:AcrR family transcriptional regulator
MTPARPVPPAPQQERSVVTRRSLLDAAVAELLEVGYARLTTTAVAQRAGVSRGAQQRYFPHKDVLMAETVRHLAQRHMDSLQAIIYEAPMGRGRIQRALDGIFEQYSGALFGAVLELSLAARSEPALAAIVAEEERRIARGLQDSASHIFGQVASAPAFSRRWTMTLATVRGVAVLRQLGHPAEAVARQWTFARRELVRLLADDAA